MNTTDTLLIFGRSPSLAEEANIPQLLEKFTSVGCNSFCYFYPQVQYAAFIDLSAWKYIKGFQGIFITSKHNRESLYTLTKVEYFLLKKGLPTEEIGILGYCVDTASMVMNWAIYKGFKNVVLFGIEYNPEKRGHFKSTQELNWSIEKFQSARDYVERSMSSYINIYKGTKESLLKVPYISSKELLYL